MQIERLFYFLEIDKAGSIKRASEHINISQQALSQSMNAMEKELGVTLLKRGRQGIILTEAGKTVKPVAEEICNAWEILKHKLNEKPLVRQQLCIGISPYLEISYYAKILNYMKYEQPSCKFDVVNVYPLEAAQRLAEGTMDLAVVSIKENDLDCFLTEHHYLQLILLQEIEVDVLVNKNSELARFSKLALEHIRGAQIAVEQYNDYEKGFLLGNRKLAENDMNFIMVRSIHTAQEMVAKNLAISFAAKTESIFKEYKDKIVKKELDTGEKWGVIGILICKKDMEDEIIQDIVELCKKEHI